MGATPVAALTAAIVPAQLSAADFSALHAGIARAAAAHACPVIGGNLSSGSELSVTTTVIGHLRGHGMYRSAARAGDAIYVTGTLGSAALGLCLLQRGRAELGPRFVEAWRAPEARIREGLSLVDYAHAAIDVSDGAYQDLGHICSASQLSAELEAARIPFAPGFVALAEELGLDPLSLALLGGEDYELIYTLPEAAAPGPGTRIGRMLPKGERAEVRVLDRDARPVTLEGHAYRHF
jgi:thiamine-monophosphate kinase